MAIYHLSTKIIGRSGGRSAVASAAYRSGEKLYDESTGRTHDYTNRTDDIESWIEVPEGAPEWARDREELWNHVEKAETRKNSRLSREIELGLPKELSREQQREVVRSYVQEQFVEQRGLAADISIHRGDPNNPHAHVMLTTRELGEGGFGEKDRGQDKKEELGRWRTGWERHANEELERAGHPERIDHRSYKEQGLDREPTRHEGPAVREMEERGIRTERGELNRSAQRRNEEREAQHGMEREREGGQERENGREGGSGREPERDREDGREDHERDRALERDHKSLELDQEERQVERSGRPGRWWERNELGRERDDRDGGRDR